MKNVTIIGSKGFIGSNLLRYYKKLGAQVKSINSLRNLNLLRSENIFYCIGVTGDYIKRPYDTVEAHVSLLNKIINKVEFKSLIYLSSTRVYQQSKKTSEDSNFTFNINSNSDLYNSSKLFGESLCLSQKNKNIKVARISNVIGKYQNKDNFFSNILFQSKKRKIIIDGPSNFKRDFISINDVCNLLDKICFEGNSKLYNLASGKNTSNKEICEYISKLTNSKLFFKNNSIQKYKSKKILINKIKKEFNYSPKSIKKDITDILLVR